MERHNQDGVRSLPIFCMNQAVAPHRRKVCATMNFSHTVHHSRGFIRPWVAATLLVTLALVSGGIGVLTGLPRPQAPTAPAGPTSPSATSEPAAAPTYPSLPLDHINPGEADLDALIAVIRAGRPADRVEAAHRLEKHAKFAARAVPALVAALEGADLELEAAVAAALDKIGPPPREYSPLLVNALSSRSLSARRYAAHAFAVALPVPEEAIAPLVQCLNDSHATLRTNAASALERAGGKARPLALGPLVTQAADLDPNARAAAEKAVRAMGKPNADDKPTLTALLANKSPKVRSEALTLLHTFITDRNQAAEVYVPLLKDESPDIRLAAMRGLTAFPDALPVVAAHIFPLFTDPDIRVRSAAIGTIKKMQNPPKLVRALADAYQKELDPELRRTLADAFVSSCEPVAGDVPTLRAILNDAPFTVRKAAADKLASLNKAAAPATDDLIALANDPGPEARGAVLASALQALAAIRPDPKLTLDLATANFSDKQAKDDVRVAAVDLLATCGAAGLKVLKDGTPYRLSDPVKAEMIEVFAANSADTKDMQTWMLAAAETIQSCRLALGSVLAKNATDQAVMELARRTDKYHTGIPGEPLVARPLSFRKWALQTLAAIDLPKVAKPETKTLVEMKMRLMTDDPETDPELSRLAAAALKRLKGE